MDRHDFRELLTKIVGDLERDRPRAVVLFGSTARFLLGRETTRQPGDIDLLVVGDQIPITFESADYGYPTEIRRMRTYTVTEIARSLRYDARPVALAKLYRRTGGSPRLCAASRSMGSPVVAAVDPLCPGAPGTLETVQRPDSRAGDV